MPSLACGSWSHRPLLYLTSSGAALKCRRGAVAGPRKGVNFPMQTLLGRRAMLRLGATAALAAVPTHGWSQVAAPAAAGVGKAQVRRAKLHNLHTGDSFSEVYFENGRYVPQALAEAMRVLRDWRNGEEHVMDPRLFDAMHAISTRLETDASLQIISGYRSPQTNAMLHERSSGVASHSQHMLGRACDIRIEGVDLCDLHKAALSVGAGGVGFYPISNFVHVDVGPKRSWTGA
jgi:uncharacterized protein YcbK (DUF882 family)